MTRTVAVSHVKTRPRFSTLWPIADETLRQITASMREHGFRSSEPIDVWRTNPSGLGVNVVVDGHTRLKAAVAAGISSVVIYEHDFADDDEAELFARIKAAHRRNLPAADQSENWLKIDALKRKSRGGNRNPNGHNQHGEVKASRDALTSPAKSAAETASVVGVSQATIERARAVYSDPEALATHKAGASITTAYKQVQTKKRDEKLRAEAAPLPTSPATTHGHGPALLTVTPVEAALHLAAVPGAFTVAEWLALDAKTKQLLIEEAPLLGGDKHFNRTNENVDWAHWTWNPVTGCLHDCVYCYARDIANRFYKQGFVPAFIPARLHAPRYSKVPAKAVDDYREANAFTCSMADLFGKWVPQEWIDAVFAEVVRAPDWRFLFLTKFPRKLAEQDWPDNAWVGTSVDRQFRVEIAEKSFRDVRAGVKWLSCEPLLERLTFTSLEMFDWVVIGGESPNSNNRAGFDPPWEWIEHLYRQARDAGCRVFFKENLRNRPKELPALLDEMTVEE